MIITAPRGSDTERSLAGWLLPGRRPCLVHKPPVSPLMIPLVYCHIKSFQRASSVEKPWPGGEKRRDGRASHHEALSLQRHLSVLNKFAHVESQFCGRKRRGKAAFDVPLNPCVRSVCSRSVVVGL